MGWDVLVLDRVPAKPKVQGSIGQLALVMSFVQCFVWPTLSNAVAFFIAA